MIGQEVKPISILTNQKYIFIHSVKSDQHFCLNCYKERLKELDQYQQYFGWLKDRPSEVEMELIDALREEY